MKVCPACNSELQNDFSCKFCGYQAKRMDGFLAFSPELALSNDYFDATSHAHIFQQENKCFWFSERTKLIIWAMRKYFPNPENFLEIGCGTGYVLEGLSSNFAEMKCTGADIYTKGLKFASEKVAQADFIQLDARHIPFINEFDIIGAFDMIEHIEDDQQVLDQMYKAVRHGGGMIATVPQHEWLCSVMDSQVGHKRRYKRTMFEEKVIKSGFEVVKIVSFMSLLLPFLAVLRGRYLFFPKKVIEKSVRDEIIIHPFLNYCFRLICAAEVRLIKSGLSFPAGGSLMCIAKKK